jgi:hypothetical protein
MRCGTATYQFALVKGREQYVVRCQEGSEEAAIAQLMRWASSPDLDFDWFDGAVLARQINLRLLGRSLGTSEHPGEDQDTTDD